MASHGRIYEITEAGAIVGWSWGKTDDPAALRAQGKLPGVVDDAPAYDPLTQRLVEHAAIQGLVVRVTYTVEALSTDESNAAKRADLKSQLVASDNAFSPRWVEDLSKGHQYAGFTAWMAQRDALRAQLDALPSASP